MIKHRKSTLFFCIISNPKHSCTFNCLAQPRFKLQQKQSQKIHSINYTSSEPQFVNSSTAECFSIDYHGEKHSEVENVTEGIINC